MYNSLGFHTFTIFQRLTYTEAISLYRAFKECKDVKVRPIKINEENLTALPKGYIVEYKDKYKGISWYVRFNEKMSNILKESPAYKKYNGIYEPRVYSVRATINPKLLIGIKDYLTAATSDCIEHLESQFNVEAAKISPIIGNFKAYVINRIDYCFNIETVEFGMACSADQLFTLLRRGHIPAHLSEVMKYNKTSHRAEPYKHDFRLQNKSIIVSCYQKYMQLLKNFPKCPDLYNSQNLIRCEVKHNYQKTNAVSRSIKEDLRSKLTDLELWDDMMYDTVNATKTMLSDATAEKVICKYFNDVFRKGDYFTLEGAIWMVKTCIFRKDKEERLIDALEIINDHRGIARAMSALSNDCQDTLKRSLKDLDEIYVNPVTIPRRWNIKHIRNPLQAYYDTNYVRLLHSGIIPFKKRLDEYLFLQSAK